jgi:hypothetical protein
MCECGPGNVFLEQNPVKQPKRIIPGRTASEEPTEVEKHDEQQEL